MVRGDVESFARPHWLRNCWFRRWFQVRELAVVWGSQELEIFLQWISKCETARSLSKIDEGEHQKKSDSVKRRAESSDKTLLSI